VILWPPLLIQFHDDDRLAHSGAAEEADLAALERMVESDRMTLIPVSNISS